MTWCRSRRARIRRRRCRAAPRPSRSAAARARLRQVINDASNVTYDGINVDAGGTKTTGAAFELGGNRRHGQERAVGNVVDEKAHAGGAAPTTRSTTSTSTTRSTGPMACTWSACTRSASRASRCAIRRSATVRSWTCCSRTGRGGRPKPPAYGNVTIENNVFAHSELDNNSGWHYYSLYVGDTGPNGARRRSAERLGGAQQHVRDPGLISSSGGSNGTRWVNNLGSWDCKSGITYRATSGRACSRGQGGQPGSVARRRRPPRSAGGIRARTTSTSPGLAGHQRRRSRRTPRPRPGGRARTGAPDAGAYEF